MEAIPHFSLVWAKSQYLQSVRDGGGNEERNYELFMMLSNVSKINCCLTKNTLSNFESLTEEFFPNSRQYDLDFFLDELGVLVSRNLTSLSLS
jgi:hypothetical protein